MKLCFGSVVKMLLKCVAPSTTQKELCGRLLMSIDDSIDISSDDSAVSKIVNGFQNVPKYVSRQIERSSYKEIAENIKKNVLPVLDENKMTVFVIGIKGILESDQLIQNSTTVNLVNRQTKEMVLRERDIVFSEFLTGILLYTILYSENQKTSDFEDFANEDYINQCYNRFQDVNFINGSCKTHSCYTNKEIKIPNFSTPKEKMFYYIGKPDYWESGYSLTSRIFYNKFEPEYTVQYSFEPEDGRDGYEYYLFLQRDPTPHWSEIELKYHQTVLYQTTGAQLDGARYFAPCPETGVINTFTSNNEVICFKYFVKGSLDHKLLLFFYNSENPEERYAHKQYIKSILIFDSEQELNGFIEYASYNWYAREIIAGEVEIPYIDTVSDRMAEHYGNEFRKIIYLQKMLKEYRKTEQ